MPNLSSTQSLKNALLIHCRDKKIGKQIYCFESCASTNTEALTLAKNGAPHGSLIFTLDQLAGRGRFGNSWQSESGNIALSIILRPQVSLNYAYRFTFVAALSVTLGLRDLGLDANIKWPNDILLFDEQKIPRKICGILTETQSSADLLSAIVIGIGINLQSSPASSAFAIAPAHINQWKAVSAEQTIAAILDHLEYFAEYPEDNQHFLDLLALYKKYCCSINNNYNTKNCPDGSLVCDVLADGALLIKDSAGSFKKIYSAE